MTFRYRALDARLGPSCGRRSRGCSANSQCRAPSSWICSVSGATPARGPGTAAPRHQARTPCRAGRRKAARRGLFRGKMGVALTRRENRPTRVILIPNSLISDLPSRLVLLPTPDTRAIRGNCDFLGARWSRYFAAISSRSRGMSVRSYSSESWITANA
jgi:hypothetical protein